MSKSACMITASSAGGGVVCLLGALGFRVFSKHRSQSSPSKDSEPVDIVTVDERGRTCLHLAAKRGDVETLQQLIGAGAKVDAVDAFGRTALHFAASNDKGEVVKVLIEAKAKIDTVIKYAGTALFTAARHGTEIKIQHLIDAGIDVNAVDREGRTALYFAATRNLDLGIIDKLVHCLLEAKAYPNSIGKDGFRKIKSERAAFKLVEKGFSLLDLDELIEY